MLHSWMMLIVLGATSTLMGCGPQSRLVKRSDSSATKAKLALADAEQGDAEESDDAKPKSKLSPAQLEAGKAFVNGWSGLKDEMPKNGKWSVTEKDD